MEGGKVVSTWCQVTLIPVSITNFVVVVGVIVVLWTQNILFCVIMFCNSTKPSPLWCICTAGARVSSSFGISVSVSRYSCMWMNSFLVLWCCAAARQACDTRACVCVAVCRGHIFGIYCMWIALGTCLLELPHMMPGRCCCQLETLAATVQFDRISTPWVCVLSWWGMRGIHISTCKCDLAC